MSTWSDDIIDRYAQDNGSLDAFTRAMVDGAVFGFQVATLDIGCGTGRALRYAYDRFKAKGLVGLDLPRMIDHARAASAGYDITYVAGRAEALPFPDEHFTMVLAINSTHHWQDQAKGLAEAARVLKPKGILVIGDHRADADLPPEGPDYTAAMAAVGVPLHDTKELAGGFFTYGRKIDPCSPRS